MKRRTWLVSGAIAIFLLSLNVTAGTDDYSSPIQGEVVQVGNRTQTRNGGEFQELTLRTRQGEEMRLRLERPENCNGCVRAGDRVRVRLMDGDPREGAYTVREMKVRRTGATLRFDGRGGRSGGDTVRAETRTRSGAGSATGSCARSRSAGGGGRRGNGRR
jgi:hypothetical protein